MALYQKLEACAFDILGPGNSPCLSIYFVGFFPFFFLSFSFFLLFFLFFFFKLPRGSQLGLIVPSSSRRLSGIAMASLQNSMYI